MVIDEPQPAAGPVARTPQQSPPPTAKTKTKTIEGYAEWIRDGYLIADGQRVGWDEHTRFKLGRIRSVSEVPLGYEIEAKGHRTIDGTLLAQQLEAKPNGIALYENEVVRQHGSLEEMWLQDGTMSLGEGRGTRKQLGRVLESGPEVDRVKSVMHRLLPPYVPASRLRLRVVDSGIWNAAAMANGAIWVHRGLLDDVSDDELAIVLGHELAHYTHEHTRRDAKNNMWRQLAAVGAGAALDQMDDGAARDALIMAAELSLMAWTNGYSRNLEDQADRAGLRYAFEGGFDVTQGPEMWARVRGRFGELDSVSNFFQGRHSRPSDRIRNIQRELVLNYQKCSSR